MRACKGHKRVAFYDQSVKTECPSPSRYLWPCLMPRLRFHLSPLVFSGNLAKLTGEHRVTKASLQG